MQRSNNFFGLEGTPLDIDANDFLEALKSSEQVIEDVLFRPDELTKSQLGTNYKVKNRIFRNVSFSQTAIRGIVFQHCRFENCLFINAELEDCEFYRCIFTETNTYKFSLRNCYAPPEGFIGSICKRKFSNVGIGLFQEIMHNARDTDQPDHERVANYEFNKWRRYQLNYRARKDWAEGKKGSSAKNRLAAIGNVISQIFFGYGLKISRFVLSLLVIVIFLTFMNHFFSSTFGLKSGCGGLRLIDSFYYTLISLTTLGYGDITPSTDIGKIVAAFQSVLGFSLFATMASLLFRRFAA